jgi:hypothetical protein
MESEQTFCTASISISTIDWKMLGRVQTQQLREPMPDTDLEQRLNSTTEAHLRIEY